MHIVICNERFLFRFGVDRALIIIGQGLREAGHSITVMANRMDRDVISTFADQIIEVPAESEYIDLNEYTAEWLQNHWDRFFPPGNRPDVAIIGGWPFYAAIPFFESQGTRVVYFDCGAVPLNGYEGGARKVQEKLRYMRKAYLPQASLITAISDFISRTQSKEDAGNSIPIKTIHLAADHLDRRIWAGSKNAEIQNVELFSRIEYHRSNGKEILFCLGRWEPGCYKNSQLALDLMQRLRSKNTDVVMLILADPHHVDLPIAVQEYIIPIGFPGDLELQRIMQAADLGLAFSLWEGFNLPLAEMQWLGKPVLALAVGAHPEVILDPWFLCHDLNEMVEKASQIIAGQGFPVKLRDEAFKRFRHYFRWDRAIKEYREALEELYYQSIRLVMDVTYSAKDPANPGIIRVTRRLGREFQRFIRPIFVLWDTTLQEYVLPTSAEMRVLGQFNGPVITDSNLLSPADSRITLSDYLANQEWKRTWLLCTEVLNTAFAMDVYKYARNNDFNFAAVFHDAIPVLHPELCNEEVAGNHLHYMHILANCDVVIPDSDFSAQCLREIWAEGDVSPCEVRTNLLPGEYGGAPREVKIKDTFEDERVILTVSTLEPRKNHKTLIKACLRMQRDHPELNWKLILVGNRYAGNPEIPEYVQSVARENPRIEWVGIVPDERLHELYLKARFTVYPSIIEGYGMPIMESLWHGRPCICYNQGVMAELAADGGCVTTDVLDEEMLGETIYRLLVDEEQYLELCKEAVSRSIKTWGEYTRDMLSIFLTVTNPVIREKKAGKLHDASWEDALYPNGLFDDGKMNNSSRLALTDLIERLQPGCTVVIGDVAERGLGWLADHARVVFYLSTYTALSSGTGIRDNLHLLSGPPQLVLQLLLNELNEVGIPIDLIYVNDYQMDLGFDQFIQTLNQYVPPKPLFVILNNSFYAGNQRIMQAVAWDELKHLDWIDLDFIPGKLQVNASSQAELPVGGLALAYFNPAARSHDLEIKHSTACLDDAAPYSVKGEKV